MRGPKSPAFYMLSLSLCVCLRGGGLSLPYPIHHTTPLSLSISLISSSLSVPSNSLISSTTPHYNLFDSIPSLFLSFSKSLLQSSTDSIIVTFLAITSSIYSVVEFSTVSGFVTSKKEKSCDFWMERLL
jgi:hypothetical protein